jgi:hypothetical protein
VKRLGTRTIAAFFTACCFSGVAISSTALAQTQPTPAAGPTMAPAMTPTMAPTVPPPPPADFGSPPSGMIPILYNDHHVYSKPDVLRQDRVLAALVRGGTVLIPLRSMFEQMGATVSYDPSSRTVTVSKPGAQVVVTVGRPAVVINGESRPLDVPPIVYHGMVLVPVRVISEGMGAYVQWLQDRHLVVVRYVPPTPPPPPAPPASAPPPPPPTPAPSPAYKDLYVAGDFIFSPKVYNEFSPGNTGTSSYAVRGAFEFDTGNIPWMIAGDYRNYQYPHDCTTPTDPECLVTNIGGIGQSFVPAFGARDQDVDARLGIRVAQPRIYLGVGYLWRSNNYGYPSMNGWGFGAEKLPDLDHAFSVYGSAWYYPQVEGTYTDVSGSYRLDYRVLKYQIGVTWVIAKSPVFIDLGWLGDRGSAATGVDPAAYTHNGPYAGLGIKF